jgi:nitroreductase
MNSEFLQRIIEPRRSIRKYQEKPVEREKILACVAAARLAPSAENRQPWRFVVLDQPERIQQFSAEAFSGLYRPTRWAQKAPVLIVLFAKIDFLVNRLGRWVQGNQFYLLDLGIAGEHFVLQAEAFGLGTCWIGWFDAKKTMKFFDLSGNYRAVALISLGYPAQTRSPRKLLDLNEIVSFNTAKWQATSQS